MNYADLRALHVGLAILSVAGFSMRWAWMVLDRPAARHRLTRTLPHVIDTLFLASGIWLAVTIAQYPFVQPWLTAKVFGLLAYIILGSIALKRAATMAGRTAALLAALAVFGWIVSVARLKSPWGFLAWDGSF